MPAVLHSDLLKLMGALLGGSAAMPATIYMGLRLNAPKPGDFLNNVSEVTSGGYLRKSVSTSAMTLSASGVSPATLTLPVQTWTFTGTPTSAAPSYWFLTDVSAGFNGYLYATGPLNSSALVTTLQAAVAVNQSTLLIPTTDADKVGYDLFNLGTPCNNNVELASVTGFGTPVGSNTPLLLASGVTYAHAAGASISRDAGGRVFASGSTETVYASITLA